jgi:hypothetical protein
MSLPNYLAKIKSAGIYRFVWDKSEVPPQAAEALRLVVGYSEKGPFNTPVYIETVNEFKTIFGNISKRLERRGVYFHRLAMQALSAGPILALNLKPFNLSPSLEIVKFANGDAGSPLTINDLQVSDLYDTNRFWALDPDQLPMKLVNANKVSEDNKGFITISSTDVKENSCSVFIRKAVPESYAGITLESWYNMQGIEMPEYMEAIKDTNVDEYFADIYVFRGDLSNTLSSLIAEGGPLSAYLKVEDDKVVLNDEYKEFGVEADPLSAMARDSNSNFITSYTGCTIPYFRDANNNYISLDILFNKDNAKHNMIMKLDESKLDAVSASTEDLKNAMMFKDAVVSPYYLQGYIYNSIGKNDTERTIYDKCVKNLLSGAISVNGELQENPFKGLRQALTNRVDVEYHYLVDTFDSWVEQGGVTASNCKEDLFMIAKEKDNAFAIVNFPKMSKFTKGQSYDMKKIKDDFGKGMPKEIDGASYGAYYTQLVFSDGSVKTTIPSAGLVSNLFMNKWSSRQPYYIVAGPNFGRFNENGLVGPDYNFSRADLDVLEPLGVNAIIYVPRKGTYINSNQTAKQVPVSGLSKVHIRELVIYLQNEIENLLQSYQWEMNTQTLRDTIKSKADAICETIMNNGGIYAFVNVCDETNNTPEVIDNEMIILDTEIEPARGAGKMVHQLTIHRTGGLTSKVK